MSGLNHAVHGGDNYEDENQEQIKTTENKLIDLLKKYKVNQEINLDDFEGILPPGASLAISKITRISETNFKVERSWLGATKIAKNAGFKIEINGTLSTKGISIKGIKITPYGFNKSENTYYKPSHFYNEFLIRDNTKSYIFNNKIHTVKLKL